MRDQPKGNSCRELIGTWKFNLYNKHVKTVGQYSRKKNFGQLSIDFEFLHLMVSMDQHHFSISKSLLP
jgi:hypothetical protein